MMTPKERIAELELELGIRDRAVERRDKAITFWQDRHDAAVDHLMKLRTERNRALAAAKELWEKVNAVHHNDAHVGCVTCNLLKRTEWVNED